MIELEPKGTSKLIRLDMSFLPIAPVYNALQKFKATIWHQTVYLHDMATTFFCIYFGAT